MMQDPADRSPADADTAAQGGPTSEPSQLEEQVTEDIAGWQGVGPEDDEDAGEAEPSGDASGRKGAPADRPAPDSGEIEWAGQVVKKPPHP